MSNEEYQFPTFDNDEYIKEGKVDVKKIKPLARLGYFDYTQIKETFSMRRPD